MDIRDVERRGAASGGDGGGAGGGAGGGGAGGGGGGNTTTTTTTNNNANAEEPWLAPLIGGTEATEPRAAAEPRQLAWIKAPPLGDDPTLHLCVAAYSSDFALLETTLLPHRQTIPSREIQAASLDHSMWWGACTS